MELYRPWILYVLIAYYIYFFIASCVNGSVVKYFGASCIQLLFLSLITFYRRDVDSCVNDFISIAKLSIILSLIMNIGSLKNLLYRRQLPLPAVNNNQIRF